MRGQASAAQRTAETVAGPAIFGELLGDPAVRERWERVRRWFFLRESTYDMTRRCNIRCEGCYFYHGDKQNVEDCTDPEAWHTLMRAEKARGITFAVLAGAEPALVPELLRVCGEHIPLGAIATNGLRRIPEDVPYRIHISVWGNDATSERYRSAKRMLDRQCEQYADDDRAVFVYTFTRENCAESREVVEQLARRRCKVTFNVFSSPVGYSGPCRHDAASLLETRRTMLELLDAYPETVLFSAYSAVAHTHSLGLHELFGCSYPRMNPSTALGLGRSFRQYRANLAFDRGAACCVPDTDCPDCRHYAAGSAVVTARLHRHAANANTFWAWLDYVNVYLAVWVRGYEPFSPLLSEPTAPPGRGLF
ncbi:MAG: radical SAM protein [Polyangiaceae bacterium]|nr:radical SAM protein [Polyangiaceae bacterium]